MILPGNSESISRGASLIQAGEVVGFPTETVYGLGANAFSEEAVEKIFKIKGRPYNDPLIVHVADSHQVQDVAAEVPPMAIELMEAFWPGPLTLVLNKNEKIPNKVTAGLSTVGVRQPFHPVAISLIQEAGVPIAAPSANRFQSISPTTAESVISELGDSLTVIDGGACEVGLESTVLSLVGEPLLLRPGGIHKEDIEAVLGQKVTVASGKTHISMSPGQSLFHYAPGKPLRVFTSSQWDQWLKESKDLSSVGVISLSQKDLGGSLAFKYDFKGDLTLAAKQLYGLLRKLDQMEVVKKIAVITVDHSKGFALALNDRLGKAQHSHEDF